MRSRRALSSGRDFRRIVRTGRSAGSGELRVFVTPSSEPSGRLGIVVRPTPSTAVERNRMKRRIRAAWDQCPARGYDVVVRVESSADDMEFQKLAVHLKSALFEAGVRP